MLHLPSAPALLPPDTAAGAALRALTHRLHEALAADAPAPAELDADVLHFARALRALGQPVERGVILVKQAIAAAEVAGDAEPRRQLRERVVSRLITTYYAGGADASYATPATPARRHEANAAP